MDHRKDVHEGNDVVAEAPSFDVGQALLDDDRLLDRPAATWTRQQPPPTVAQTTGDDLPIKFDSELLNRLRIPEEHHAAIMATGLSLPYCSLIRPGRKMPHWEVL